jgi:hypothetical protein
MTKPYKRNYIHRYEYINDLLATESENHFKGGDGQRKKCISFGCKYMLSAWQSMTSNKCPDCQEKESAARVQEYLLIQKLDNLK